MLIPQDRSMKCVQGIRQTTQLISASHNKGPEINQIEILMNGRINYLNPSRFYHLKARRETKRKTPK